MVIQAHMGRAHGDWHTRLSSSAVRSRQENSPLLESVSETSPSFSRRIRSHPLASDSTPRIESITPAAAIPGGEIAIHGSGFAASNDSRPRVIFGEAEGSVLIAGETHLIARVPEGPGPRCVRVATSHGTSAPLEMQLGVQIADNLHPVANPAVDAEGNIYVTYSGQRGQKVPVSLYKVTANYQVKPFVTEMMNPTGLALDSGRRAVRLLPQ